MRASILVLGEPLDLSEHTQDNQSGVVAIVGRKNKDSGVVTNSLSRKRGISRSSLGKSDERELQDWFADVTACVWLSDWILAGCP